MLTDRFRQALLLAYDLHTGQTRKGTDTPYFAHLIAVTALVIENGGDDDQAIAALLHDSVEDQGGLDTLEVIRERFGDRVARMVLELSDATELPKPPWRQRKLDYLAHLPQASRDTLLISLADKLHNARSILQDYEAVGDLVWDRFTGGKEGVLWYYRSLADFFARQHGGWMAEELGRVVAGLEERTGGKVL